MTNQIFIKFRDRELNLTIPKQYEGQVTQTHNQGSNHNQGKHVPGPGTHEIHQGILNGFFTQIHIIRTE